MIEAAGGVVWQHTEDGVKVLLVHRPRYDDWSLPKGKLEPKETAAEGALREVREETGLRCELGVELTTTRYRDRKGRRKRVRYWAMQPRSGAFRASREVDAVRWMPAAKAAKVLTYRREVAVVESLAASLALVRCTQITGTGARATTT